MQALVIFLFAAIILGVCRVVDRTFERTFRSKAQHRSGLAVRANKRYGVFGVMLCVLGILSGITGIPNGDKVLLFGGSIVFLLGVCLIVHYLSFGIFYDGESFLLSSFGKPSREYRYADIVRQKLYVVTGGSVVIELELKDGKAVSLQSSMDGIYPFLDTAFAGWCIHYGKTPQECDFYDPSKSWWFPHEEEV